jgi:hypothetical protein
MEIGYAVFLRSSSNQDVGHIARKTDISDGSISGAAFYRLQFLDDFRHRTFGTPIVPPGKQLGRSKRSIGSHSARNGRDDIPLHGKNSIVINSSTRIPYSQTDQVVSLQIDQRGCSAVLFIEDQLLGKAPIL